MNGNAVKAKIVFNGMSVKEFIDKVNAELEKMGKKTMSQSSYYKNIRGEEEFDRSEINAISTVLKLENEEILNIFFDE